MLKLIRWKIAQAAEFVWWKFYLLRKAPANYLRWKADYWKTFLHRAGLAEIDLPGVSIMDVGCGPAGIFMLFKQATVVASDPLIQKYEHLPHFKQAMYPRVRFLNLPLEELTDDRFDYVFCINAINHVKDLQAGIARLANMVSKGGTLVISVDAHNHAFLKKLFQLIPGDILHPHQHNLKEYKQMLEAHQFVITHVACLKKETIFSYYVLVAKR